MVEGEWGIEAGQFFKEWRESKHVVEPFKVPDEWMRFRSMDWGSARPYACLWWAVDYDGNMYCYRELYGWGGKPNVGTGETAAEVGRRICELEKKEEHVRGGLVDRHGAGVGGGVGLFLAYVPMPVSVIIQR